MEITITALDEINVNEFEKTVNLWREDYVIEYINVLDLDYQEIAKIYFTTSKDSISSGGNKRFTYVPCVIGKQNNKSSPPPSKQTNRYKEEVPIIITNIFQDSYEILKTMLNHFKIADGVDTPVLIMQGRNIPKKQTIWSRVKELPRQKESYEKTEIFITFVRTKSLAKTLIKDLKQTTGKQFKDEFKKYLIEHTKIEFPKNVKKNDNIQIIYGKYPLYIPKKKKKEMSTLKLTMRNDTDSDYYVVTMQEIFNYEMFFNNIEIINKKDNSFTIMNNMSKNNTGAYTDILINLDTSEDKTRNK